MSFPIEVGNTTYTGSITKVEVYEMVPPGVPETKNIIRTDQQWGIRLEWKMCGDLAEWLSDEFHVTGFINTDSGEPRSYPLPEVVVPTLDGAWNPVERKRTYSVDLSGPTVPAGTYKVTVRLQLYEGESHTTVPVGGFAKCAEIMFMEP
jgi:hypothetical protein